jgi:5-methyltetrahydrofolate--homocysteine methyltransferase
LAPNFSKNEIYIPEMILSAQVMSTVLDKFKGVISGKAAQKAGKVLVGTVKGDLHDIGKNLVIMMLKGQGFEVKDLGVSVDPGAFAREVATEQPEMLALSALLTTTMKEMKTTIEAVEEAGLRSKLKIIIGGAPVNQEFADQIGADGYAYDAPGAAKLCKQLLV